MTNWLKRKHPWVTIQWEDQDSLIDYTEEGVETGAKLDLDSMPDCDAKRVCEATKTVRRDDFWKWIKEHRKEFSPTTLIASGDKGEDFKLYQDGSLDFIYVHTKLNTIRHLNTFLSCASEALTQGGYIFCHARTALMKRKLIFSKYPKPIAKIVFFFFYIWHRVCPKLKLTGWLYYLITKGNNRTFHRVEIMGRVCRAGFEIVDQGFRDGEFFVFGRKTKDPIKDDYPSCGPLVKLNRIGYQGKLIGVYKFRTMYSYSEYLQPYMLAYEGLQEGGKFANDFRINGWGKLLRKSWLDEFPMLINLLKGQMKLVGVRPLSRHYFSLYSPEMQELRIKVKPGLLPPFYYDKETPKTIEDVQTSERRYIESYLNAPFRTEWRYFWGTMKNILIKRKRSH